MVMALELVRQGELSLEQMVHKICHAPAIRYQVAERGYLREGYWADLVLVDDQQGSEARDESSLYKCGWTPLHGQRFSHRIAGTWVNGIQVWDGTGIVGVPQGRRIDFEH